MTKRNRQSRFTKATATARGPLPDEVVTQDERIRRSGANARIWAFMSTRTRAANMTADELHTDDDPAVRTDAVGTVEVVTDEWALTWILADQDGTLVARSLHLEALPQATPPGGITTNLLREISPGTASAALLAHEPDDSWDRLWLGWAGRDRAEFGPEPTPAKRRGRKPVDESELARIAVAYVEELKGGPGVTRRLAGRFAPMPEDTVRDRIRMCRDRGFLSPTKQGRRGGTPGPRLIQMLKESSDE